MGWTDIFAQAGPALRRPQFPVRQESRHLQSVSANEPATFSNLELKAGQWIDCKLLSLVAGKLEQKSELLTGWFKRELPLGTAICSTSIICNISVTLHQGTGSQLFFTLWTPS